MGERGRRGNRWGREGERGGERGREGGEIHVHVKIVIEGNTMYI